MGPLRTGVHRSAEKAGWEGATVIVQTDRFSWQDTGVVRLDGMLGADRLAALRTEASQRAAGPTGLYERDSVTMQRDGSVASPAHCRMTDGGPALTSIVRDKAILAALRQTTGLSRLLPVGGALVIYNEGDFQGFHTDSIKATVTVTIALTDGLQPMGFASSLRYAAARKETHPRQLAALVTEHGIFPEGFEELQHPFDEDVVQGFAGHDIPHWRSPHPAAQPGMIATIGYMDL